MNDSVDTGVVDSHVVVRVLDKVLKDFEQTAVALEIHFHDVLAHIALKRVEVEKETEGEAPTQAEAQTRGG